MSLVCQIASPRYNKKLGCFWCSFLTFILWNDLPFLTLKMGQFSSIRYGSRVVNNTLNVFYRCGHSIVFCNFAICLRKFNFAKCFNTLSRKCNSHFFPRRQICCVHFNDTNRPSRGFERTGIIVSVTRLGELLDFGQLWKLFAKINLPKSSTFLGVSKSIIFLVKSFLGNFWRHLAIYFWSHWS